MVGVGSVKTKMFDGMVRTLTDVRYVLGFEKESYIFGYTLGFVNIVFMGNTRGLVLNLPYTTLKEF